MFRKLLAIVLLCCTTCIMLGQQTVSFQYLSKKDGLSQASVFAIAQDSSGFMWFGTRDGLNKFDGYQFKIYKNNAAQNSLVANDIRTLYLDPQRKELWIGTNSGLSRYQSDSDDFINYLYSPSDVNSLSRNVVRQIYRDSKGRLWIGTEVGLNLYQAESNDFKRFFFNGEAAIGNQSQDVKAILEDRNGEILFGTANGLYQLKENINKEYGFERIDGKQRWNLSDVHIKSLLEDKEGNIWIGTFEGGLNYWNRKEETITIYQSENSNSNTLSHNNIRSMCLDKEDNLWIGTFDGLNFLKKVDTSFTKYRKTHTSESGLSDKSIRSVFIDSRGSLWVGTYYGGINHLDENYNSFTNFKYTPFENSLSGDVVSSFAEDEAGNLWIGTEGGGLNYYDTENNVFTTYQYQEGLQNTISGNSVKQLLLDGDQLWIGTFQSGLNLFDIQSKTFKHFKNDLKNSNSLSNNNVYGLHKEEGKLYILTYGGGLDILDLEKNEFYNYQNNPNDPKTLSSDYTRVLLKTKDGKLWIATERGLNKVTQNAAGFPESFEQFLPNTIIYSLQEDAQKNIWIGTISQGLYRLNPASGEISNFTTDDGLPGNTIFGILEAGEESLWLSTNNGLSKFNPRQKTSTNYNYSNGLENSEYNFNAYFKTRSGDLLFGGINGFTKFDPNTIEPNEFIPPIVFTELRQNNKLVSILEKDSPLVKDINETEKITFSYNEANFSIGFAALDYFSPDNNHYAFMLEGLDRDWNHTLGETEATYTIQREGDYIFRLKGANSDGIWNPVERKIKITVLPPPWRTWWAYLVYLLIFGAAFFALIRFIRLRHKLQLQQIAKQQQEELHEVKLRFFTNIAHEFRTPLTLIIGPLKELITKENHSASVEKQLSLIERNAQRLLNLVNQVLTFRKLATDHEPLEIINGNIVLFLQELFLPFQETANLRNIAYHFKAESAEINAWYDQDKLEKVFFNLLSNAFKFTPDGGRIEMSISQQIKYIVISVKDSGVGIDPEWREQVFKRFYEKSNIGRSTIKGTGIGLAISKQMVELHKGKIFVADNTTSTSSEKGTNFIVQIPTGQLHFKKEEIVEGVQRSEQVADYNSMILSKPVISDTLIAPSKEVDATSPLLLIVEDNAEIRAYIQQVFVNDYRLITAENGAEGLRKTKKNLPDLIISDVMMPEMDGITFCGKLKTDIEISHIPIILLTARTASLFKIEGLKTGADDYVTKPFNPEELRLRARNIIQAREEVRRKFARVLHFDPKEISITSADEKLLEKALQIVEKHMENYEFNVIQFATELAVSRPLLFTKLKALTGQTPNNFIKTIRLKRAAQLLKTKKLNVSEVAYKVGFKDPKYFRKCFQQQFDVSPSLFEKSNED